MGRKKEQALDGNWTGPGLTHRTKQLPTRIYHFKIMKYAYENNSALQIPCNASGRQQRVTNYNQYVNHAVAFNGKHGQALRA